MLVNYILAKAVLFAPPAELDIAGKLVAQRITAERAGVTSTEPAPDHKSMRGSIQWLTTS